MRRLRIIHNLRSVAFIMVTALILAAVGVLLWANNTGMPASWRQAVERGIAKHGIHVEIGSLSYHPLQGIIARKVRIFSDASREKEVSRLEGVLLDLDNSKLAKGQFQLAKVELNNATLILPVSPDDPDSEILEITDLQGTFIPPGNRNIEIRNATGSIAGIKVTLNAKIFDDVKSTSTSGSSSGPDPQREVMSRVIRQLQKWRFDTNHPPHLKILLEGHTGNPDATKALVSLSATNIEKNRHRIEQIHGTAEIQGGLLTVTSLEGINGNKKLSCYVEYDLERRVGRFDLDSSLEIPQLLQSWLEVEPISDLLIAGPQHVEASGDFEIIPGESPKVHMTGKASCGSAMLRGVSFDSIELSFSKLNNDFFFKDINLSRSDGSLKGKALVQSPLVRLSLEGTLPPENYSVLFNGRVMQKVIDSFETDPESKFKINLEGGFDLSDRKSWAFNGHAEASDLHYNGVALRQMETGLSLSSRQLDFTNGVITYDYTAYPLATKFAGPMEGTTRFDRVRYSSDSKMISVTNATGSYWPAPMVRLFSDNIANLLDRYEFHSTPTISGEGTIGIGNSQLTDLNINFSTDAGVDYELLGKMVTLEQPSGRVAIQHGAVTIDELKLNAFNGEVNAKLHIPKSEPMEVEVISSKLSMDAINQAYELNMKAGGELTGRIAFSMMPGEIATMQGDGLISLEKTALFSVPMFGPLSHLLSAVLGDKRAGFERAKSAFCTFKIVDGSIKTRDFSTTTSSLVFKGNGSIDLTNRTINMIMRVDARGFLKIITFPFRPFYGMFQFRGTGPLSDTTWEHVMFTKPEKDEEINLTPPPKARLATPD